MSLWRQIVHGLRALTDRARADRDESDEVQHYLEQATEANLARGLSPDEARRAARLELGSATGAREEVRAYGWENAVESLLADLRYAVRRLVAQPGFTAVTVLTLAVGIGATTAIFSAVHPILLEPLPYPQAGRIMALWDTGRDGERLEGTFGTYRELRARSRTFDAMAVTRAWQPILQGTDQPEGLGGQHVSADYFRILGIPPLLGQDFQASDDRAGAAKVVILSHPLWQRRFAGDPAIIGRTITLDDRPYLVTGVMPRHFENVLLPSAELWTTLNYDMSEDRAWGHHLRMVGRLAPGSSVEQARQELAAIARSPVAEFPRVPWASLEEGLTMGPLQDDVTRGVRPALLAVVGAVLLLLAIASVNVTNLLLARGVQRRGELALRAALGAGHGRLIRQLLTESLLLAAVGGIAGMAVAALGVRALVALSPPALPRLGAIGVDGAVLFFGIGVTTLVGLAFGLTPAVRAVRDDPRITRGHGRTRAALVVAQVAFALLLLLGSGLLLRSLQRLFAVDVGLEPSGLLTLQVQTSSAGFEDEPARLRFFAGALEAVRNLPGVTEAALTSQLPLSGDLELYGVHFDPAIPNDPGQIRGTFRYAVSPGYIETMDIPLRRGRVFDERDRTGAPRVVLISEGLARRRLPGVDPIGLRLRIGPADSPPFTVVGIVGDVKQESLALDLADAVYLPAGQWHFRDEVMSLVVRATGDPAALVPAIREAVWSVDKNQAIVRIATMNELVAASMAERRLVLTLFEAFAIAALTLAAAGIYGVLSGSVAERTREIGVRTALGASRPMILALVLRQGMALTGLGIALGIAAAAAATQALVPLLFGVSRLDPGTYLGMSALLGAVAMLACWIPAWRAARVDVVRALREEG